MFFLLQKFRKRFFKHASTQLKPGGIIVYSTCSLEIEENQDVVENFLSLNDFELVKDDRFEEYDTGMGYLIFPQDMEGSGAFAAKLRKLT